MLARILCLIVWALPSAAMAGVDSALPDHPDSVSLAATCDSMVVIGRRPPRWERLLQSSCFATRIDVTDQRGPAEEAAGLLEGKTGLTVRRYGGPGALATLSVRGLDPGHIEVFLDRIPLRSASQGIVDLGGLDLAHIESIEVYRSAPPADLGGQSAGAAIRLVPREGDRDRSLRLRTSRGSYGTETIETAMSGSWKGCRGLLSASRFTTDGDFAYHNDRGTEHEPSDDAWESWSNGDLRRESIFTSLSAQPLHHLSLAWSSQFGYVDQGLPGSRNRPTRRVRRREASEIHRAELSWARIGGRALQGGVHGYRGRNDQHYRDPEREIMVTGALRELDQEELQAGAGLHLTYLLRLPAILGDHRIDLLGEWRDEELHREQDDRRHRVSRLLTVGDRWAILEGRLQLEAVQRWEEVRNNYTGVSPWRAFTAAPEQTYRYRNPRLGGRASLGRGHTLRFNWGRHARFPSFFELFGYEGAMVGNPHLTAEVGNRWDGGWTWNPTLRPAGMEIWAEVAYYHAHIDDMILYLTVSERETKPFNLDAAELRGAEMTLSVRHLPGLAALSWDAALTAHLHLQKTRDESPSPVYAGKELTYHPPLRAGIHADLERGRWRLRYTARYQAASYWGRSNLEAFKSEGRWDHDLLLRWQLHGRISCSLRIENLMNRSQEDIRGYPLPLRSWFGGLDLEL